MDKWDKRFMEMTRLVSTWSSCYKQNRQVGAVIVRDKRILTTGYNGASSGIESCAERGECLRRASISTMTVTIDGIDYVVDLNGAEAYKQVIFSKTDLSAGNHTVTITAAAEKSSLDTIRVAGGTLN